MKNSGTDWLGQIPNSWQIGKIGQIYTERHTKVSDTDYAPLSVTMQGIVPQLSNAAKTDAHDDRKLVCKGDFAINSRSDRRGSCGISAYDGSVSLINTILAPRGEMNPNYYNWLFHTSEFASEFYKWGHGIVDDLWTTNWGDMKRIQIPIPPFAEQQRIADFLDLKCDNINKVLEKTKTSIEEYKKLKQSIITEAVTKGIRGERPMKGTGIKWLKDIPCEWQVAKLKNIFTIFSGTTPDSNNPQFWDGDIHWITPADYKTKDKFVSVGQRNITIEGYNSCGTKLIPSGSIVFSKRAPIGSVAITQKELCTNQGCLACVPKTCNVTYYYYAMSCFTEQFNLLGSGTTFKEISASDFSNFPMPYPSIQEQQEIATYLDLKCSKIDALIESKERFIKDLEMYRKSLIFEYITGKKEVE